MKLTNELFNLVFDYKRANDKRAIAEANKQDATRENEKAEKAFNDISEIIFKKLNDTKANEAMNIICKEANTPYAVIRELENI